MEPLVDYTQQQHTHYYQKKTTLFGYGHLSPKNSLAFKKLFPSAQKIQLFTIIPPIPFRQTKYPNL